MVLSRKFLELEGSPVKVQQLQQRDKGKGEIEMLIYGHARAKMLYNAVPVERKARHHVANDVLRAVLSRLELVWLICPPKMSKNAFFPRSCKCQWLYGNHLGKRL